MLGNLLIIDDDRAILESLELLLRGESKSVDLLWDPNRLNALMEEKSFDAVLLDMNFTAGRNTGNEGLFWLKEILARDPELSVITITAYGDVDLAVKSIKLGAFDFIQKPWKGEKLLASLGAACKLTASKRKVRQLDSSKTLLQETTERNYPPIIGQSPRIHNLHRVISKVAGTDTAVLIQGENGTGKELIAWEIHRQSDRAGQLFVPVDLGALTPTLFESELFGHKKGAFTDAKSDRAGRFESASGGTLFLDEIGNIPLHLQAKLLTVLQHKEILPLGAGRPVKVDVRIVSATNQDLEQMVRKGLFREDLYYRINTIRIEAPPLRERGEDIGLLAEYFLERFSRKYGKAGLRISNQAFEQLIRHAWPGNIRELQHVIENAVIMSDGERILAEELPLAHTSGNTGETLNLEQMEKQTIRKALARYNGNYASIAAELGISRTTLYHKIRKYDL
jgi:DNA-binding NtrC family response regulator